MFLKFFGKKIYMFQTFPKQSAVLENIIVVNVKTVVKVSRSLKNSFRK